MMFSLFLTFRHPTGQASDADLATVSGLLRGLPGVTEALVYTPAATHDPYLDDGQPPPLVLQLRFSTIETLEAALRGDLAALATLPSLAGAEISEQAMLTRGFDVPEPNTDGATRCTYLVAYEGDAEDVNLWLSYYIRHHPPIMARFPQIRAIEICTRLDWCSGTGWRRELAVQRNKVVFDTPDALTAALNSPVRHEMRADFVKFPPFTGANTHFAMLTHKIV